MEIFIGCLIFLFFFGGGFKLLRKLLSWERIKFPSLPRKRKVTLNIESTFDGFIGNEGVVHQIKRLLRYAEQVGERKLPNLGLFGPKSTGKTELARRIATALDIPMLVFSKSTLSSEESFFEEVAQEISDHSEGLLFAPEMIIFIDEAHVLPRRIQDAFLTALEKDDRCFRSRAGDINTRNVTFIIATTDPGKLSEAFRNRLFILNLEPYSIEEIVRILKWRREHDEEMDESTLQISDDALILIAKAARATPRRAIELLRQIGIALYLEDYQPSCEAIKRDLWSTLSCDENGFVEADRKYMNLLSTLGRPVGLNFLAAALGIDKDNIEKIIEPWLIQNGLVLRTGRGRKLSPKGSLFVERNL